MQSVSSRISTRVTVLISYDDNHYTTGRRYDETIFMIFIMYNGIGAFNWDVFSQNLFPTEKTEVPNVLDFFP